MINDGFFVWLKNSSYENEKEQLVVRQSRWFAKSDFPKNATVRDSDRE